MIKRASSAFLILIIFALGISLFINQRQKAQIGLEGFYELTLKDPLFYSSFFDAEEFEKAIKGLKEEEAGLKKVATANLEAMGYYSEDSILILKEQNLFPYHFLEILISINQKTEEFLVSPSKELANDLLSLYDLAADSYLDSISLNINSLEKISSDSKNPSFLFFVGSVSSAQVVKNDYLTIKENGYQLKEEIAKRRNCLLGKENCQALIKTKDNSSFIALVKSMETEEFDLEGENIDFIKNELFTSPEIETVKGPYKIKSFCWQNPDFGHWMYLIYYQKNSKVEILPKLANQIYYWSVLPELRQIIAKLNSGEETKFSFQPEAATYECLDLTFYPQLLILDFLKEQIEKGLITEEELENNLNYKLLIENQFGLLAPVMNNFSDGLKYFKLLQAILKVSPTPSYLLLVRTGYSIFYFPFAKSIWRIDKQLQYFIPEEEKPETPPKFISIEELRKKGYSDAEIKKFYLSTEELEKILKMTQS